MNHALLDTNILLRYLTEDVPEKTDRSEHLIRQAIGGQVCLYITDICIAEAVWILKKFYKVPRREIADKLFALFNTPGLEFSDVDVLIDATHRFRSKNVSYPDAHLAALVAAKQVCVYSYDRDLGKFCDVKRKEP
ncbi:MAG: PIN domain-containing protein [Myxococcota bacterium]